MTDAQLVRALADLAEASEPKRRAKHLVKRARELAERLEHRERKADTNEATE